MNIFQLNVPKIYQNSYLFLFFYTYFQRWKALSLLLISILKFSQNLLHFFDSSFKGVLALLRAFRPSAVSAVSAVDLYIVPMQTVQGRAGNCPAVYPIK